MKKTVFVVAGLALFPFCAFAVDGVVLINQSTVMAQGGFPYRITQAGSYRLSGNLVAGLNQMAIKITASNVVLDLNGFNIKCSFDPTVIPGTSCIGDGGAAAPANSTAIRNGTVAFSVPAGGLQGTGGPWVNGIGFESSNRTMVESLSIDIVRGERGIHTYPISLGVLSIVRNNIFLGGDGFASVTCPSVIEGNATVQRFFVISGEGCGFLNNVFL